MCETNGTTCVGDGPAGMGIVLADTAKATYTDDQIQAYLVTLINAGTIPMPTANTIYNIYFPSTTTITSFGEDSCVYFDAYHSQGNLGSLPIYYSVVPECAPYNPPGIAPIDLLQNDTLSASHEIIETASDGSATEYSFYPDVNDPQNWGWLDFEDGEVADLCVDAYGLGGDETIEANGYMVQRIWSIPNATVGKNPCVPIPTGEVYFNAAPTTSVLIMNVGDTQTVEVDAWSDAPMAAWTLNGQDETDSNTSYISISFVGGTLGTDGSDIKVQNGDKVMATVKLLADPAALNGEDAYGIFLSYTGTANEPSHDHYWPFVVMTPAEASDGGISSSRRIARARDRHLHRIPHHVQLPPRAVSAFRLRADTVAEAGALQDPVFRPRRIDLGPSTGALAAALDGRPLDAVFAGLTAHGPRDKLERALRRFMLLGMIDGVSDDMVAQMRAIRDGSARLHHTVLAGAAPAPARAPGACCQGHRLGPLADEDVARLAALGQSAAITGLPARTTARPAVTSPRSMGAARFSSPITAAICTRASARRPSRGFASSIRSSRSRLSTVSSSTTRGRAPRSA